MGDNMSEQILPVGKLPPDLLAKLLAGAPVHDTRVVLGPGIGLDCAVVEHGDKLLVFKSDPITFVTDEIGRYLVQVNANDVATTGALPRWLLVALLLPERGARAGTVEHIMDDVYAACRELNIAVIGGHTEVTYGLSRPIAVGTLVGEVARERLVTPRGATPGDRVLLTKGVPIEGTSVLARAFPERVRAAFGEEELKKAREFLVDPGISVVRDAELAMNAGKVTAMHDPTEGGLAAALWELAEASGCSLEVDPSAVPIPALSAQLCRLFAIDPLATIASGALLLTAPQSEARRIQAALEAAGIACAEIGEVGQGPASVIRKGAGQRVALAYPKRDALAQLFE